MRETEKGEMNETYYVKPPAERNNNEERKGKKIYNE
jgi:hypothetical protein